MAKPTTPNKGMIKSASVNKGQQGALKSAEGKAKAAANKAKSTSGYGKTTKK